MTNAPTPASSKVDAAIDALLANAEHVSIVDGLFALSNGGGDAVSDGWNRAVYNRLQARLARRMRETIGDEAKRAA